MPPKSELRETAETMLVVGSIFAAIGFVIGAIRGTPLLGAAAGAFGVVFAFAIGWLTTLHPGDR